MRLSSSTVVAKFAQRDTRCVAIETLLFDWDGTLVDSAQLGLAAFHKTFATIGIPFSQEVYEATYSPNWYAMYRAVGLPEEKWKLADHLWIEHYGEQMAALVAGAEETILNLHRKGYHLGIVSSGSDCRVGRELNQLGLRALFEVVVCNEQMVNKKPHPEGLETAIKFLQTSQEQCCYIGDSPEDIQMGKTAKMMTIGVRSSYPTSRHLPAANPDIYLESLSELANYF